MATLHIIDSTPGRILGGHTGQIGMGADITRVSDVSDELVISLVTVTNAHIKLTLTVPETLQLMARMSGQLQNLVENMSREKLAKQLEAVNG